MLADGGRSLEHLREIYDDVGLRHLIKAAATPSTDAVADWLRRMGAGTAWLTLVERPHFSLTEPVPLRKTPKLLSPLQFLINHHQCNMYWPDTRA